MKGDVVVFAHPDGVDYVAVGDDKRIWRWPARANGWKARKRGSEDDVDTNRELPSDLAHLALRLSNVTELP